MRHRIIIFAALLMLGACQDDTAGNSKAAEAARIEREVKRRVEVVERDLKVRQTRMHTIRITGFILLAGGSVALLVRLQRQRGGLPVHMPERHPPVTQWKDHYPVPESRIIDPDPPEPFNGQQRNRSPSPTPPPVPNPNRRRNHRHAPTPRP